MRKLVLRTQVRRRSREYRRTGAGNGEARGPSDREQIGCPHRPSPDARSHTSEVTMSSTPTANPNRNFVRERRRSATTAPSRFSLRYTTRRGYRTVFTRVSAPRPPVLPPPKPPMYERDAMVTHSLDIRALGTVALADGTLTVSCIATEVLKCRPRAPSLGHPCQLSPRFVYFIEAVLIVMRHRNRLNFCPPLAPLVSLSASLIKRHLPTPSRISIAPGFAQPSRNTDVSDPVRPWR